MIIDGSKQNMAKLFNSTVGKKEYELLLRKMDMGERHYAMVDAHIKNLKSQVDREVEALQNDFLKRLQAHKLGIYSQLDGYQKLYIQNMEAYRAMLEPIITFNTKSKYYCSAGSISLKLLAEIRRKSAEWYLDLKRIMTVASRVVDRPMAVFDSVSRSTQYMSSACEELPFAKPSDAADHRPTKVQLFISESLGESLMLKELKPIAAMVPDSDPPKSALAPTSVSSVSSQRELPNTARVMPRPTPRY